MRTHPGRGRVVHPLPLNLAVRSGPYDKHRDRRGKFRAQQVVRPKRAFADHQVRLAAACVEQRVGGGSHASLDLQFVRPHPAARRIRAIVDELQGAPPTVQQQQRAQQHSALTGDHVQIRGASVFRRVFRSSIGNRHAGTPERVIHVVARCSETTPESVRWSSRFSVLLRANPVEDTMNRELQRKRLPTGCATSRRCSVPSRRPRSRRRRI
jgi:hypothetical protein